MNEKPSGGFQRAPTDAGTFAGAKVRLAKVAQYIATFRLAAVAPYLLAPVKRETTEGC